MSNARRGIGALGLVVAAATLAVACTSLLGIDGAYTLGAGGGGGSAASGTSSSPSSATGANCLTPGEGDVEFALYSLRFGDDGSPGPTGVGLHLYDKPTCTNPAKPFQDAEKATNAFGVFVVPFLAQSFPQVSDVISQEIQAGWTTVLLEWPGTQGPSASAPLAGNVFWGGIKNVADPFLSTTCWPRVAKVNVPFVAAFPNGLLECNAWDSKGSTDPVTVLLPLADPDATQTDQPALLLKVEQARFAVTLQDDGSLAGNFGGLVRVKDVYAEIARVTSGLTGGPCPDPSGVTDAADAVLDAPSGSACDALSFGFAFTMKPVADCPTQGSRLAQSGTNLCPGPP